MKNSLLIILVFVNISFAFGQNIPIKVSINYGIAGNFFVNDYEQDASEMPAGVLTWYNKDFLGSIGGTDLSWNINNGKNSIGLAYDREVHHGLKNDHFVTDNGTHVYIKDIKLRHLNEFYQAYYKRSFYKKTFVSIGFFIQNISQQEITYVGALEISERNHKNSNLQEGGIFIGLEYYFYSSGKFDLGVKSKLFYTASLSSFESITLTPVLTYNF